MFDGFAQTIQEMHSKLVAAQQSRDQRTEFVSSNDSSNRHPELGWVVFERQSMFDAVNAKRHVHKLPPINMELFIRKVEQLAVGHCDYTQKIALYCAEMAHGRIPTA
jgi:hypothetical protein